MGTFRKVVVAFFVASLCLGVQAAKTPPVKAPAKASTKKRAMPAINYQDSIKISQLVTDEMRANFLKFMILRQSLLVPLDDPKCKYQTGGIVCVIQVPVYLLTEPHGLHQGVLRRGIPEGGHAAPHAWEPGEDDRLVPGPPIHRSFGIEVHLLRREGSRNHHPD
jgi:hypothetical protein